MTDRFDVVIVGAGQGGAQTASTLRQQQFSGTIALVGDEPDAPYERPALSKEYLAGDKTFEKMLLRPVAAWADKGIELRLGERVTEVDAAAHRVRLEDGASIEYGKLVWSTGGAPRRLVCSGHDLRGVHTIRSRADVDKLGVPDPEQSLGYVMEAVRRIKKSLAGRVPLIGFSGAPWTLAA